MLVGTHWNGFSTGHRNRFVFRVLVKGGVRDKSYVQVEKSHHGSAQKGSAP